MIGDTAAGYAMRDAGRWQPLSRPDFLITYCNVSLTDSSLDCKCFIPNRWVSNIHEIFYHISHIVHLSKVNVFSVSSILSTCCFALQLDFVRYLERSAACWRKPAVQTVASALSLALAEWKGEFAEECSMTSAEDGERPYGFFPPWHAIFFVYSVTSYFGLQKLSFSLQVV